MKKLALLFFLLQITGSLAAQTLLDGRWEGSITVQGQELGIILSIEGDDGAYSGTLDIPAQGASDLPLIYIVTRGDSVSTAFNTGTGLGEFEGRLINQNQIEGTYSQSGSSLPFKVERKSLSSSDFNEAEAVTGEPLIISNGDINIAGTLVVPEEMRPSKIVVMLSGSGPQNRDSEIVGFRPFAVIAGYLKEQGISTFRFDDRQVGESTGIYSQADLFDLTSDVNSIITFLQDSVDTSFEEIILLGHSLGGVVAGEVAESNPDVDKLILMASPAVTMMRILRDQVSHGYERFNLPMEAIEQEIGAREDLMRAIASGNGVETARKLYKRAYGEIINSLSEDQLQAVPENREAFIERQAEQLVSIYSSPQMRSLLFYDPSEDLRELSIPVLVLFGGKDTQVSQELNTPIARQALVQSGTNFQIKILENANHLFQKAETGNVTEYANLDKEFVDSFLPTISEWIDSE